MSASERFRNNRIDKTEFEQLFAGKLKGFSSVLSF